MVIPVDTELIWCAARLTGEPYDVVNNAGSIVLTDGHGADRGFGEPDGEQFDEPCDVFAWCGGAVLLRSDYLADVGLFDERFFLYYEDTDLSWRGRARGWRYHYVPDAVVRHMHAATTVEGSSTFAYFTERNRLLMLLKNAPRPMVREAVGRYVGETYDAARRDIGGAIAQGRRPNPLPVIRRARALAGFGPLSRERVRSIGRGSGVVSESTTMCSSASSAGPRRGRRRERRKVPRGRRSRGESRTIGGIGGCHCGLRKKNRRPFRPTV